MSSRSSEIRQTEFGLKFPINSFIRYSRLNTGNSLVQSLPLIPNVSTNHISPVPRTGFFIPHDTLSVTFLYSTFQHRHSLLTLRTTYSSRELCTFPSQLLDIAFTPPASCLLITPFPSTLYAHSATHFKLSTRYNPSLTSLYLIIQFKQQFYLSSALHFLLRGQLSCFFSKVHVQRLLCIAASSKKIPPSFTPYYYLPQLQPVVSSGPLFPLLLPSFTIILEQCFSCELCLSSYLLLIIARLVHTSLATNDHSTLLVFLQLLL